ncbi:glycosyltransferase family 2 protein [Marinilabilia sp.]
MNKTDLPKVTIVTPSYNQAEFLEETIKSVLNQTYPNIEYIVVDGGSTDGSVDIIKKYEDQLAWWVSEPDNGQSDAINKGFAKATGDVYNWLNSDDILYPDAVKIAVHFMQKHPESEVVYGDRIVIDGKGRIIDVFEPVSVSKRMAKFALRIPQEATFFSARIWKKVNGLNESLHFVMDSDLWYRFLEETRFFHIPVFLGAYRNHEESKSVYGLGKEKSDKAMAEIIYLRKNYSSFLSQVKLLRKWLRYFQLLQHAYERNKRTRRLLKEEVRNIIFENKP